MSPQNNKVVVPKRKLKCIGQFSYPYLSKQGVIYNQGTEKDEPIVKERRYAFYEDQNGGYRVEVLFKEVNINSLRCIKTRNEAILEMFEVDYNTLFEMRRTFST